MPNQLVLHLKITSRLNNKIAKIYREGSDFIVHIYNKPPQTDPTDKGCEHKLESTYFPENETDAIVVAQLELSY